MSKSWFYLGIISSLAILTSSCGGDSDKKATAPAPATSPAPAATPTTAAAPTSTAAVPTPTNPVTPAITPGAASIKPISPDLTAGLIPSTEAENWSRTVAKGRPDPFAALALQPVEIAIENTSPQSVPAKESSTNTITTTTKKAKLINPIDTQPSTKIATIKSGVNQPLPKIKISAKLPKIATASATPPKESVIPAKGSIRESKLPISAAPKSGVNRSLPKITGITTAKLTPVPATPKSLPKITGITTAKLTPVPATPKSEKIKIAKVTKIASSKKSSVTEPPSKTKIATKPEVVVAKPLQAMAIEISGMIDVAGKTQVIIKLPTESFSRYIEVGERILNGKVLVKRVEGQNSLSPTIVLEEVGVEVARKIGDKSTPVTPEAAPIKP